MHKTSLIILLSVCLTAFTYYGSFPTDFDSKTAAEKSAYLTGRIQKDGGVGGAYYGILDLAKLPAPTILGGQDLGPVAWNTEEQITKGRKKLIHSVAKAASMEFRMTNHSAGYTGSFAAGVKSIGFVRMSSAKAPDSSANTPGISFKILRDGQKSGNFMAMWMLEGQSSPNFFENPMSNHVNTIPSGWSLNPNTIALKILSAKFEEQDKAPNMVGVSTLAMMTPTGQSVSRPKSPFQLVFGPNPALKKLCAGTGFDSNGTYSCFSKIAAGTQLYKIYALASPKTNPTTSDLVHIGGMYSTSTFANSKTFDEEVQFAHTLWDTEVSNMGAAGASWASAIGGSYKDHAGAPKCKNVMPAF